MENRDSIVTNSHVRPFRSVHLMDRQHEKGSDRMNTIEPSVTSCGCYDRQRPRMARRLTRCGCIGSTPFGTLMPFFSCRVRRRSLSTVSSVW